MKEKIKLVDPSDFNETDEDYNILGIQNLNNSSALFIICNNKTILVHLTCFSNLELSTVRLILEELRISKYKVNDIRLYIGSDCDTSNLENFLNTSPVYIKKYKPFIDENGNETIAYNEETKSTFGIIKIKYQTYLVQHSTTQHQTLSLAM